MARDTLQEYRDKRNLTKSREPSGERSDGNTNLFVLHKHDASNLHYDFRIRIGDALKSWVVPKGPSTDPKERRLAMPTEDHPVDYADFEGVIPEDEYGGGTVMVWDKGTYDNIKTDDDGNEMSMEDAFKQGTLEVRLKGEKLRGGYALIRTGGRNNDRWLLIKMKDDEADARRNPVSTEPKSVMSGRSLDEIAREEAPSKDPEGSE